MAFIAPRKRDYLRWSILRRLPVFLSILGAVVGITMMLVERMPDRYTATARLLLQSSDLSGKVSPLTRQSAEAAQAQIIEQRLMTDHTLREIAVTHGLIRPDYSGSISSFRNQIRVQTKSGRDRATLISVTYSGSDPQTVRDIANALAGQMLADNIAQQSETTEQRLLFYRDEVADARRVLSLKTEALSRFKTENADSLPDVLDRHLDRQSRLEDQLRETSAFTPRLQETSDERALAQLREEWNAAQALFSPTHPYLRMLNAKIELARATVETRARLPSPADHATLRDSLRAELAETRALIAKVPATAVELDTLNRERRLAETRYTSARDQLAAAELAAQEREYKQGDRLTLIEQAVQPVLSSTKRRRLFLLVGTALSIFIATMSIVILNRLDRTIRRADMLQTSLGITAFGTLPNLRPHAARG